MKRKYVNEIHNLTYMPPELMNKIMINLDLDSLNILCNTNKSLQSYCDDDYLWRKKYKKEHMNLSFLDDPYINKDVYMLAYNILNEGKILLNDIKEDYYVIYIYLPILTDDTEIINHYLPVKDAYTGILKLTVTYLPKYGYVYKKQLIYYKNYENFISVPVTIDEKEMIELLGYIIYSGYKLLGTDPDIYINDDDTHDDTILSVLYNAYIGI